VDVGSNPTSPPTSIKQGDPKNILTFKGFAFVLELKLTEKG